MATPELPTEEKSEMEDGGDGFSDMSDSDFLHLDELLVEPARVQGEEESSKRSYEDHQNQGELQDPSETSSTDTPNCSTELPGGYLQRVEQTKEASERGEKRKLDAKIPLERYHMKYLCVTDLCSQGWCEQQMVYSIELPGFLQPERVALMDTGASIHLARELEVHNIVSLSTKTREDSWAVKFMNLLSMISALQAGCPVREFPVFGEIDGVFLVGVIDELHYSPKGELELSELKTRGHPTLPSKAQKRNHHLQVKVYKRMFDAMVRGQLNLDNLIGHLCLRPEQPLGAQVKEHAQKASLTVNCFGDLLELISLSLTFSDLPIIDRLTLEYHYQKDNTLIGTETVHFEEGDIDLELRDHMAFWKGQRETKGVDIEETWKCRSCSYVDICEWRKTWGAKINHTKRTKK